MAILDDLDRICFRQGRTNGQKTTHDNDKRTNHDDLRAMRKKMIIDISEKKTKGVSQIILFHLYNKERLVSTQLSFPSRRYRTFWFLY